MREESIEPSGTKASGSNPSQVSHRGKLETATRWADFLLKVISASAILVGGAWTYRTFVVTRSDAENVTVSLSVEQIEYSDKLKLLVVHAKPKNAGRTLFKPKAYRLSVRQVPLNAEKWKAVDIRDTGLITTVDMLAKYKGYDIEPGVEYDDIAMIPVPNNVIILIRAEIEYGDGSSFIDAHEVRATTERR